MNTGVIVNIGESMPSFPDSYCMDKEQQAILAGVVAMLDKGCLDLPALPDMASRFQELFDAPTTSTDRMVDLLSTDPVVSMYVIRSANSAALSNGNPVSNLRSAVLRLGYRMLRSMVINITMTRLFRVRSQLINRQLARLWKHSRSVAAISYALAKQQKHLRPEDAMLAGLVHDIGALPFYLYADRSHLNIGEAALDDLACRSAAFVGTRLLKHWNFPAELVGVAGHAGMCRTNVSDKADYADVVMVANLLAPSVARPATWEETLAAERLGHYAANLREFPSCNAEWLVAARSILGIGNESVSDGIYREGHL